MLHVPWFFCSYLFCYLWAFPSSFPHFTYIMTKSLSSSPKHSRAPDPIMTSTSSLSKSSLASSAASLSPSASILLSAAANRTSMPTGSRSSSSSSSGYRKGQPPIAPLSSSSLISTSSSSSSNRNAKLESIIQVGLYCSIAWIQLYGLSYVQQNFYTKTAQIIIHSRIPHMKNTPGKKKLNKWVRTRPQWLRY